jgi:hypothetical protein
MDSLRRCAVTTMSSSRFGAGAGAGALCAKAAGPQPNVKATTAQEAI